MDIQELRAKRLNEVISASGYSYAELEALTGFSKSSLQRYATGETKKIPIDCVEKIAQVTNSDARYLIGWEDWDKESESFEDEFNNREEQLRAVISAYLADKKEQELAIAIVRELPRLSMEGLQRLLERVDELVKLGFISDIEKEIRELQNE